MKSIIKKLLFITVFAISVIGFNSTKAHAESDEPIISVDIDFTAGKTVAKKITPQKTGVYQIYFSKSGFVGHYYWCDSTFDGDIEGESVIVSHAINTPGAWISNFYMVAGKTYYFALVADEDCSHTINLQYYTTLPTPTVGAYYSDSPYTTLYEDDILNNAIPGVSWDDKTYTLTLNNTSNNYHYFFHDNSGLGSLFVDTKDITDPITITIDIQGNNTIESLHKYIGYVFSTINIYELKFTGNGTLNILLGEADITTDSLNVTIDGPTINIKPREEENQIHTYLGAQNNLTIKSGRLNLDLYPRVIEYPKYNYYIFYPQLDADNIYVEGGTIIANYHDYTQDENIRVDAESFLFANNSINISGGTFYIAASERTVNGFINPDNYYGLFYTDDVNGTINVDKDNTYIKVSKPIDYKDIDITIDKTEFEYDGTAKKPKITVPGLIENLDYVVTYSNNIEVGTGKVTVTPINNSEVFTGSKEIEFAIKADPEINKINAKITDKKYYYRVLTTGSADKAGTVSVVGLKQKSIKSVKIAAEVKLGGITFKVVSISKNAFKNNKKITKATIGLNVKTIASNAFYGCKKLKQVSCNSKVLKSIGKNAFKNDKKLKKIIIKSKKLKKVAKTALKGVKKTCKIVVPKSKKKAYKKFFKKWFK